MTSLIIAAVTFCVSVIVSTLTYFLTRFKANAAYKKGLKNGKHTTLARDAEEVYRTEIRFANSFLVFGVISSLIVAIMAFVAYRSAEESIKKLYSTLNSGFDSTQMLILKDGARTRATVFSEGLLFEEKINKLGSHPNAHDRGTQPSLLPQSQTPILKSRIEIVPLADRTNPWLEKGPDDTLYFHIAYKGNGGATQMHSMYCTLSLEHDTLNILETSAKFEHPSDWSFPYNPDYAEHQHFGIKAHLNSPTSVIFLVCFYWYKDTDGEEVFQIRRFKWVNSQFTKQPDDVSDEKELRSIEAILKREHQWHTGPF